MQGDTESGVTIMHMVKKMDAGDIIKVAKTSIGPEMTYRELEHKLCRIGSQTLLEVLQDIKNNIFLRIPQDHSLATLAPKIELEECEINWHKPADEIHNLIRGVNPHPGAWCKVHIKSKVLRLKIFKSQVLKDQHGMPGEILKYDSEGFYAACGKGALRLQEVQLEGKKLMSAEELIRGIHRQDFIFA
jgi:methionyl-tRNA formyltransferase